MALCDTGALDLDILGGSEGELSSFGAGDAADVGDFGDAGDVDADIGSSTFLTGLGLRKVPLTISLTTIAIIGWVVSLLGNYYVADSFSGGVGIVIRSGVFLVALLVGLLLAAVLVRPLAPLFHMHSARSRQSYIGSTCRIDTGSVNETFGQAKIEEGGDVLVISIRCDTENTLKKGATALVIDYDDTREAYLVEEMDRLLTDKKE